MIRLSGAVELPCLVWVWVFPVPSSSLPSTLYSLHPAATLTQPSPSLYPAATRWLMKWCRTCLMSTVSTWVADAREYWAHKTLLSTFQLIGLGFETHTTHCLSINGIFKFSQKINDICVFNILLSVALFIWLWLLRLASEANNGTGQLGRGQGVIVGIMATLACIIQQLPTSHTLHTPWYSESTCFG